MDLKENKEEGVRHGFELTQNFIERLGIQKSGSMV